MIPFDIRDIKNALFWNRRGDQLQSTSFQWNTTAAVQQRFFMRDIALGDYSLATLPAYNDRDEAEGMGAQLAKDGSLRNRKYTAVLGRAGLFGNLELGKVRWNSPEYSSIRFWNPSLTYESVWPWRMAQGGAVGQDSFAQQHPGGCGHHYFALLRFNPPSWAPDDARYQEGTGIYDNWRRWILGRPLTTDKDDFFGPIIFGPPSPSISPAERLHYFIGTLMLHDWTPGSKTCTLRYAPDLMSCFNSSELETQYHEFTFDRLGEWNLWESILEPGYHVLLLNGAEVCRIPWATKPNGDTALAYYSQFESVEFEPLPFKFTLFGTFNEYYDRNELQYYVGFERAAFAEDLMFRGELVKPYVDLVRADLLKRWGLQDLIEGQGNRWVTNPFPLTDAASTNSFPALAPSGRSFTPGGRPVSNFVSESGASVTVSHSNYTNSGSTLDLDFRAISIAEVNQIRDHYARFKTVYEPFPLSYECIRGLEQINYQLSLFTARGEYTPKGQSWLYAQSPEFTTNRDGTHDVSVRFRCVPEKWRIVIGGE